MNLGHLQPNNQRRVKSSELPYIQDLICWSDPSPRRSADWPPQGDSDVGHLIPPGKVKGEDPHLGLKTIQLNKGGFSNKPGWSKSLQKIRILFWEFSKQKKLGKSHIFFPDPKRLIQSFSNPTKKLGSQKEVEKSNWATKKKKRPYFPLNTGCF